MARKQRVKAQEQTQTAAQADAALIDSVVEGLVDTDTVLEDEIDPAILAMLAGDEPEAPTDTVVIEAEAEDEPVIEIDPATAPDSDVEAVLAQIAADAPDEPAKKKGSKAKTTKAKTDVPAAPARQFTDVAGMTEDQVKNALGGISAKKVLEKAKNLIESIERGKKLSNFTKLAVSTLVSEGSISGADLVKRYEAAGLSLGTARAQSQQMTALFKALGIAQPDATNNKALVIANKPLVDEMFKLAA